MEIKDVIKKIISSLENIYDEREAKNIAYLLTGHVLNISKEKILSSPELLIDVVAEKNILNAINDLKNRKPIQYILGHTLFYNCTINVNENVLIPRPETEELVRIIIEDIKNPNKKIKILDIGTGSGCIAITLKKNLPHAEVHATDISEQALFVAKKNATGNNTEINFYHTDIMDETTWPLIKELDVIVSNPPYVRESEKIHMNKNVLNFEPPISLFVSDDDPLKFYKAIARYSENNLKKGGSMYLEINEAFASEIADIFKNIDFIDVLTNNDIHGKPRFLTCRKP